MGWTSWMPVLLMLIHVMVTVEGKRMKVNMTFDMWEGNVTVLWDPPIGAPVNALYQVQKSKYASKQNEWNVVSECEMITETRCNLGNLMSHMTWNVQVGLFKGKDSFDWSKEKRIHLSQSKLLAPDFNLSSTTDTVKVQIKRKQFLEELFQYGLRYTVTLQPKGQDTKIVLEDEDEDGEVEFGSLLTWQEYCVHVTVEFTSAPISNTSLERCIYPASDMSLIISVVIFGILGITSFLTTAFCCFLKRPGKMPAALKSAVNGWHPMNVGLVQVETVIDKGWLLTSNKIPGKEILPEEKTELSEEEKERRESTDSGVSFGQHSMKNRGTDGQTEDDDSGCGSLTGTEDSLGGERQSVEELHSLDGGVNSSSRERTEDSGLGMGHQDVSHSLREADSGQLSEIVVAGDGYRSQSPSDDAQNETTVPCDMDTNMAIPSSGYRSGRVTCLCSDFETCMWCKDEKLVTTHCDSVTNCSVTIYDDNEKSSYLKKLPVQTKTVLDMGDLSECSEPSSLFISCPLFLQDGGNVPSQLDTLPLTLGDVELTFT